MNIGKNIVRGLKNQKSLTTQPKRFKTDIKKINKDTYDRLNEGGAIEERASTRKTFRVSDVFKTKPYKLDTPLTEYDIHGHTQYPTGKFIGSAPKGTDLGLNTFGGQLDSLNDSDTVVIDGKTYVAKSEIDIKKGPVINVNKALDIFKRTNTFPGENELLHTEIDPSEIEKITTEVHELREGARNRKYTRQIGDEIETTELVRSLQSLDTGEKEKVKEFLTSVVDKMLGATDRK